MLLAGAERRRKPGAPLAEILNGNSVMRATEASFRIVQNSSRTLQRALRLAVIAMGVGLAMTACGAKPGDDDEDDKTFAEKIIKGIMKGIGGTNQENEGQHYHERAPLGRPPTL